MLYIYIKNIYKAKNHAQHTSTDCSELVREGLYVLYKLGVTYPYNSETE